MGRSFLIVLVVAAATLAVGASFLAGWDIPAPTARIEKTIPNDRLPR